ncbi:unnamed protein product [Parascedosporium putredinis]|uniref:FHA domain-containing protein n=1 Tax=Parascedosporium putredinis TaxID=1442378 RepID=A0A9P1GYM6_9PEZI|nr:unnamed protein product [Parascedosporium putredinis]CAI7990090.1 unnamed protein product [Parascedosporium putredinis]
MDHSDFIAFLLPSYGNALAMQAIQMRQNKKFVTQSLPDLLPSTFTTTASTSTSSVTSLCGPFGSSAPAPALQLRFSHKPKSHLGFLLGTDASACDIVLPKLPGISRRHCYITFDTESRLVLRDTSKNGTAVWYDHHSNGDRRGASWVLSSGGSYGFPDSVRRIVIDIQTVRFQIVVNAPLLDIDGYVQRVDDFLVGLAQRRGLPSSSAEVESGELRDIAPLFSATRGTSPGRSARYVKYTLEAEDGASPPQTFLWNTARPWDPVIPVSE